MHDLYEEIKQYVGFSADDEEALAAFRPHVQPRVRTIGDRFYHRILSHPQAHAAIQGGAEQIERLKASLREWLLSCFVGPYDEEYCKRRERIGRVHVLIGLPQHFIFTAMNGMRLDLRELLEEVFAEDPATRRRTSDAIDRLLDLELAIMQRTYLEDAEEAVLRQERLATIGRVAGSIAHELRNPLGVMKSSLFLARQQLVENESVRRHMDKIEDQLASCSRTISNLLELARQQPPRYVQVSFPEMLEQVLHQLSLPEHVQVKLDIAEGVTLEADAGLLHLGLLNLILNSAQALEEQPGQIEVRVHPHEEGELRIEVRDDGPGFDPDTISQIMEPLITRRARGTGLGLPLVRQIAERHGGTLELGNHPLGGAHVRLTLPLVAPESASTSSPDAG